MIQKRFFLPSFSFFKIFLSFLFEWNDWIFYFYTGRSISNLDRWRSHMLNSIEYVCLWLECNFPHFKASAIDGAERTWIELLPIRHMTSYMLQHVIWQTQFIEVVKNIICRSAYFTKHKIYSSGRFDLMHFHNRVFTFFTLSEALVLLVSNMPYWWSSKIVMTIYGYPIKWPSSQVEWFMEIQ